jgi:Uncharacterized protein containing a TIR (Toll-Interleukin 1-resistance) domain
MMKRDWDLLFSEYDLRAVLEAQISKVNGEVLGIEKGRFERETDELLSATVASKLVASPIELLEDRISVSATDAKVDVRYDQDRFILDRSRPFYVDGLEVMYHLPFLGDKELFKCRPNSFTLNPPRAVIRSSTELTFPYDQPDRNVASTKARFQQDLVHIKQWLPWVNQQVGQYNASLEATVRQRVQQRRQDLKKTEVDLGALGYAVRTQSAATAPAPTPSRDVAMAQREARRGNKRKEYDVALSFAGENRDYVEQVAEQLVQLGVTVFYDRFEQVSLWGKDLAAHLGQVYSKDAHFVVLFASHAYADKAWPNHERQFALGRHLGGEQGRILPVRMDDTETPGIPGTIAYLDARVLTPTKLAELIRQKVDSEGDA